MSWHTRPSSKPWDECDCCVYEKEDRRCSSQPLCDPCYNPPCHLADRGPLRKTQWDGIQLVICQVEVRKTSVSQGCIWVAYGSYCSIINLECDKSDAIKDAVRVSPPPLMLLWHASQPSPLSDRNKAPVFDHCYATIAPVVLLATNLTFLATWPAWQAIAIGADMLGTGV